jgi:enolase
MPRPSYELPKTLPQAGDVVQLNPYHRQKVIMVKPARNDDSHTYDIVYKSFCSGIGGQTADDLFVSNAKIYDNAICTGCAQYAITFPTQLSVLTQQSKPIQLRLFE